MKGTPIFMLLFFASANFFESTANSFKNEGFLDVQLKVSTKQNEPKNEPKNKPKSENSLQNLAKRWKLIEIYQLDTAQHLIKTEEISSDKHRQQQTFHCHEMGLEYQALIFTQDSLVYRLERHLENESSLYRAQRYIFKKDQATLTFMTTKEEIQVLHIARNLLILGRQKNLIEVYIPLESDGYEHQPPHDYIWQYYQLFFPKRFKRFEEG